MYNDQYDLVARIVATDTVKYRPFVMRGKRGSTASSCSHLNFAKWFETKSIIKYHTKKFSSPTWGFFLGDSGRRTDGQTDNGFKGFR